MNKEAILLEMNNRIHSIGTAKTQAQALHQSSKACQFASWAFIGLTLSSDEFDNQIERIYRLLGERSLQLLELHVSGEA